MVTRQPLKVRAGPAGVHVFDRSTGLNLLLDEVIVPPGKWSAAPRIVSIALTNACNLRCSYCYAPKEPANLDAERLIGWLDELDAHGCLGIGFGGGEPTLSRDLIGLCRHVTRNTGMAVTFTTHGHQLDERLAAELRGNVHFIRVSMDGVGLTYERLRGRSFTALIERLSTIRALSPFGINFVVNALTFPDLDRAVTLAAEHGATEFLMLPEQPVRGRGGIDSRTSCALAAWVSSYRGPVPLTVSEAGAAGLPTCDPLPGEAGLRAYAHIDASGTLKRSSYDQAGVPIGPAGVAEALRRLSVAQGGIC
jgi:sulfatase maturation enzyme AslB (radical SAM superfamily)